VVATRGVPVVHVREDEGGIFVVSRVTTADGGPGLVGIRALCAEATPPSR